MLITCPDCATNYEINAATLGDAGRVVRCGNCRQEWFARATRPAAPELRIATPPPQPAGIQDAAASRIIDEWTASPVVSRPAKIPDNDAEVWHVPRTMSPPIAPASVEVVENAEIVTDIESAAAKSASPRERRRLPDFRPGLISAIIGIQLLVVGAIVVWRAQVVALLPQTAPLFGAIGLPVNLRGIEFLDVHASKDPHDSVTILVLEGKLVNVTDGPVAVPRLRFALRNMMRAELISWTAPADKTTLAAGEMLAFRSRLASPPPEGYDVVVRFLNSRDFQAGVR